MAKNGPLSQLANQDSIKEQPRNQLMGVPADMLAYIAKFLNHPDGTLPLKLVGGMVDPVAKTLDRLSYGDALGTGAGMTWKPHPETVDTALTLAPFAKPVAMTLRDLPVGMSIKGEGLSVPGFTPDDVSSALQRDNFLTKFGDKATREAALAKRVQRAAEDSKIQEAADQAAGRTTAAPTKNVRARVGGGAVDPDFYRQMEASQGRDAVLSAVRAGKHLKPDGAGGYIGAPRTVNSPQSLGALRRDLDAQFDDGVAAIEYSDPQRLGTWYDRAKAGIASSTEPHQLDRVLDQHAVYSAGVSPESELGFALKHLNSRINGEPSMAYRGAGMRNLDKAEAAGTETPLAFKVGEYRAKNDPRLANYGLFGVNDFRAAQGFRYTTPDGLIWKGGVTNTMHPFMDAETALAVDRANTAAVGGRTDWQGPHLQEVPWVYGKAQDLYTRGSAPTARFGGENGREMAVREANNTAQDYMYKHAGSGTYEYTPGANTGHVPSVLGMTPAEKAAYGEAGRWDLNSPYTLPEAPTVGAGRRDALYSAAGFRQLPSIEAPGLYTNSAGVVEQNPAMIARPLLDYPTGGKGELAPITDKSMSAIERFRAVMDAQEAGAWNMPNTMNSAKGRNGFVMDSRARMAPGAADPAQGVMPTPEELADLSAYFTGLNKDIVVAPTSRGVSVFGTGDDSIGALTKAMRGDTDLPRAMFNSDVVPARVNSGYVPGIGKFDDKYNLLKTDPYSGEATRDLLKDLADTNPELTQNLGESEAVRSAIRDKIARDAALPGARGDIQNTRNFFAEADWPKAVEMIRQGMTPAAALAAMGYSLNSMAAEPPAP